MGDRSGVRGARCATAIGLVESTAFEDYSGGEEYSVNVARTIGAGGQWRIRDMLEDFKAMTTLVTQILIRGHGRKIISCVLHSVKHNRVVMGFVFVAPYLYFHVTNIE